MVTFGSRHVLILSDCLQQRMCGVTSGAEKYVEPGYTWTVDWTVQLRGDAGTPYRCHQDQLVVHVESRISTCGSDTWPLTHKSAARLPTSDVHIAGGKLIIALNVMFCPSCVWQT
jgi:hypothetical protein